MSKGMDDMVKNDFKKLKRIRQRDSEGRSLPTIMEYTFWGIALLFLVGMLAAMPFVGPDKAIPGLVWLAGSIGGMMLFGGLALVVKQLPDI